jgi:NAD(P)-dependent dehydrogenase (short-subunit alcohol dehydrogenase family)
MENARVAVIAGGTRGIGLALVATLARAWGPDNIVYLTARKPADGERAVAAARKAAGPSAARIDWLPFDLVDRDGAERLARTLVERHGGVDVADLNGAFAPAQDAPPERDARPMIEANNHGALRFLRAMAPILRENGRLVITASGFGLLKNLPERLRPRFDTRMNSAEAIDRAMDDYVAAAEQGRLEEEGWPRWINIPSKIGQVAVTRAFARGYAADPARKPGVLINAVCPGVTLTEATAAMMDTVFKGRAVQTPDEAAAHVAWLLTLPAGTTAPYGELVQQRRVLPYGD